MNLKLLLEEDKKRQLEKQEEDKMSQIYKLFFERILSFFKKQGHPYSAMPLGGSSSRVRIKFDGKACWCMLDINLFESGLNWYVEVYPCNKNNVEFRLGCTVTEFIRNKYRSILEVRIEEYKWIDINPEKVSDDFMNMTKESEFIFEKTKEEVKKFSDDINDLIYDKQKEFAESLKKYYETASS